MFNSAAGNSGSSPVHDTTENGNFPMITSLALFFVFLALVRSRVELCMGHAWTTDGAKQKQKTSSAIIYECLSHYSIIIYYVCDDFIILFYAVITTNNSAAFF